MAAWTDLRDVGVDPTRPSRRGRTGILIGGLGLALVAGVAAVGLVTAGGVADSGVTDDTARAGALGFGLNTTALAILKIGIAVTLTAIVTTLWVRADAVAGALGRLRGRPWEGSQEGARARIGGTADRASSHPSQGEISTESGHAHVSPRSPPPLLIHRIARVSWAPMLIMGGMAVAVGLALSWAWADAVGTDSAVALSAWTQGLQFLGEGLVLAGISFLLGTVLYGLRTAGGEVQRSLGVPVVTLRMPLTAKLFVALMALGMMIEMAQLAGYALVATGALGADAFVWLSSVREVGLGLLLSGIVLALATVASVLGFQFTRVTQLASAGS